MNTNTDLVSRSAVLDIIKEERRFIESLRETTFDNEDRAHNTGELGCAIRLARKIKDIPAIDVAPVVRAEWKDHNCTNCFAMCVTARSPQGWVINIETPYCPHCGARMDGEAE